MRITDLLKRSGMAVAGGEQATRASHEHRDQEGNETAVKVTISSLAHRLSEVSALVDEEDLLRRSRIESLAMRVREGNYSVSSKDVAGAILRHVKDNAA